MHVLRHLTWAAGALALLAACSSSSTQTPEWGSGSSGGGAGIGGSAGSGGPSGSSSGAPSSSGSPASSGAGSASSSGSAGSGSGSKADAGSGNGSASSSGATSSSSGGSGARADAGSASSSGSSSGAPPASDGGTGTNPFGCTFAWGAPDPRTPYTQYTWLKWATTWEGYEIQANGSITSCGKCNQLAQVAAANMVPSIYAYVIGYYGHANGLQDQNVNPNGPNLATGMGAVLLGAANAACPSGQFCDQNLVVKAYAYLAQQIAKAVPSKPVVWLLEGDYIQYTDTSQSKPLTFTQLGQLAGLIVTAVKANEPLAVVAIDHSTWNTDAATQSFWTAIDAYAPNYDLVWTSGVGNNGDFITTGTTASSYNGKTATWSYLHSFTGRKILTDSADTFSTLGASALNSLISHGLIGVNVNPPQGNVTALAPQLSSTCP